MSVRLGLEAAGALAAGALLAWLWAANAGLRVDLSQANATISKRDAAITEQNAAIARLESDAAALAAGSAAAAHRALAAGALARAALPAGHGPAVMNQWLASTFSP